MLLYDEFGTPSQLGLDVLTRTGNITLARERFAGLDSSKAVYLDEMKPYIGRRMSIAGIVWTATPMPHPQFVVDFEGGGRALLKMNEALVDHPGYRSATEISRRAGGPYPENVLLWPAMRGRAA